MSYELLKYLKSSVKGNWLRYYELNPENDQEIVAEKYNSQDIYQLTQDKLEQISAITIIKKTVVIFIVESNPVDLIAAFLAGIIAEVNLFLCDPAWQQREWQQVLKLVEPDLIFGDRTIQDLIGKINAEVNNSIDNQANLSPQSLIMIPTGGTSGRLKFAIHNWSTLTASVTGFKNYFHCQSINSACTLPLYHVSGLMQFMRSFVTQGNLALFDYKAVLTQQISLDQAEYFISLVPTQLQRFIESQPDWLSKFKTVLLGGAPASHSLLDAARKYQIPLALTYGMTETASGIITLKPEDFLAGNTSNGKILPHAQVEIARTVFNHNINQKTREIKEIASKSIENNIGLVKIKSESLCLGYYPQFFDSEKSFITDDLGYFDVDNYLHLVGRNSQKIITGGRNVFPVEVEAIIYATNLVQDICVIGISDPKWGQAVTAIYVPLESQLPSNLIHQKIQSQLAKYKQPKNWIEVDSLPRNNRGKINYPQLSAIALQALSSR
ncbi:MAG: 2-succinylbenzoate--CoA ligase [Cyanobacteria bacterium P01_G01_bin.67]